MTGEPEFWPPLPSCACGALPIVIFPGSDGDYTDLLGTRLYIVRPTADLAYCPTCAASAGWPQMRGERSTRPATEVTQP